MIAVTKTQRTILEQLAGGGRLFLQEQPNRAVGPHGQSVRMDVFDRLAEARLIHFAGFDREGYYYSISDKGREAIQAATR